MPRAFSKIWIVVIVVILLTGGVLAWQYFGVEKETPQEIASRDVGRKLVIHQIVTAQEIYYAENDQYYQSENYPSNYGNKEVARKPLTLSDCEQFPEVKLEKDEAVMSAEEYMQKAEAELIEAKKYYEGRRYDGDAITCR